MIDTPISILEQAADLGLRLAFIPPDTLDVKKAGLWPQSFADRLRDHKPQLIALLGLPFVMVFSETLKETVFFCADDDTRDALIEAGASEWSIYTRAELQTLCEANRVASLSPDELCKVHEIRRNFSGRISS